MKLYKTNPANQAAVELWAPLLPYGVEVEHPAHGRGQLLGIGFASEGQPLMLRCHFPETSSMDDDYEARLCTLVVSPAIHELEKQQMVAAADKPISAAEMDSLRAGLGLEPLTA